MNAGDIYCYLKAGGHPVCGVHMIAEDPLTWILEFPPGTAQTAIDAAYTAARTATTQQILAAATDDASAQSVIKKELKALVELMLRHDTPDWATKTPQERQAIRDAYRDEFRTIYRSL